MPSSSGERKLNAAGKISETKRPAAETDVQAASIRSALWTLRYGRRSRPRISGSTNIFGLAAMTTRGFEEKEAATVAHLVAGVLEAPDDAAAITRVAGKVKSLCDDFPVLQRLSFLRMRLECR